ncbi:MAG: NUDIX hydrolase [Hamadaea sp.]|nr:NUDIX hydrolase [Hamadaea sp.]
MVDPFAGIPAPDLEYFRRQAAEFAASGAQPAPARLAATVVLLRPDGAVLLMRRATRMVFGGRWAFPGGSADPEDAVDGASELQTAARAAIREVREETGLELTADDLIAWTRWITPEFEPRRFDTYFFVGLVDEAGGDGVDAGLISAEADDHRWITPADALRGYAAGELSMLPPTALTLRELADIGHAEAIRAAAVTRDLSDPILPRLPAD